MTERSKTNELHDSEDEHDVRQLVIVGASLAGYKAAQAARSAGFDGHILLIGDEAHLPYDRPPLSKQFLTQDPTMPLFPGVEAAHEALSLRFRLGMRATALDTKARQVLLEGGEKVAYDALIIATGATPKQLPIYKGIGGVHTLRGLSDARDVRNAIEAGRDIAVLGAGFIGAEIASAARKKGSRVTIIEASQYPLERALGRNMGQSISQLHLHNGVDLRCGVVVTEIDVDEQRHLKRLHLSDATTIETDFLLVSIGARPATDWLIGSGVALTGDGGVESDEFLESSVPGVYAAGDVVEWPNATMARRMRLEHWTSANEQGAIAGRNAVAPRDARAAYATVPYFWSDWYGNRIQFVGKPGEQDPEVVFGSVESGRFVALYREGDVLLGALAVNEPGKIMKDRRRIVDGISWEAALSVYDGIRGAQGDTLDTARVQPL